MRNEHTGASFACQFGPSKSQKKPIPCLPSGEVLASVTEDMNNEQTVGSGAGPLGHVVTENSGASANERLRRQSAAIAGVW